MIICSGLADRSVRQYAISVSLCSVVVLSSIGGELSTLGAIKLGFGFDFILDLF